MATTTHQEELLFEQLAGGVIRQRVGQQSLDHEDEVDQGLEAGLEVVDDLLAGVLHEGQEADVAEQSLEDGRSDVRPSLKCKLHSHWRRFFVKPSTTVTVMH